jgi:predicted regulator of Ras-like GTPase activity (Roadblock/LC7/MglB family)
MSGPNGTKKDQGMSLLSLFTGMSEVKHAVLANTTGELSETMGEIDGKELAAVMALVANQLDQAGSNLGLGPLEKLTILGEKTSSITAIREGFLVSVGLEPNRSTTAIERKLDRMEWNKVEDEILPLQDGLAGEDEDRLTTVDLPLGKEDENSPDPFSRAIPRWPGKSPPLFSGLKKRPSACLWRSPMMSPRGSKPRTPKSAISW